MKDLMLANFIQTALIEMNVKEVKGKNHNPRILQYHKATSLKASADEIAWCAAFANWILAQCGIEGTNSAMARSFEKWGKELKKPTPGCLVVFSRGDSKIFGHVAFYMYETSKYVYCLGGNQSDSVSIAKYAKNRVICYRTYA